jgi:hypothetical protein
MINRTVLTQALRRLGPAELFLGNPLVASGMVNVGALEGDRTGEIEWNRNVLTAPEYTGDIPHDMMVNVNAARITTSVILNAQGAAIWPKISPVGRNSGGSDGFEPVVPTAALLIPRRELGQSLRWDAVAGAWERTEPGGAVVAGALAAPVHALWLWRSVVSHGSVPYPFGDGGKSLVDITVEGMYDELKPDGARVFTFGDPRALASPVAVIL